MLPSTAVVRQIRRVAVSNTIARSLNLRAVHPPPWVAARNCKMQGCGSTVFANCRRDLARISAIFRKIRCAAILTITGRFGALI